MATAVTEIVRLLGGVAEQLTKVQRSFTDTDELGSRLVAQVDGRV